MSQIGSNSATKWAVQSAGAKVQALDGGAVVAEAVAACSAALLHLLYCLNLSQYQKQHVPMLSQQQAGNSPPQQPSNACTWQSQQQLPLGSQQVLQQMRSLHQQQQLQHGPVAGSLLVPKCQSHQRSEQHTQDPPLQHTSVRQPQQPSNLTLVTHKVWPQVQQQQQQYNSQLTWQPPQQQQYSQPQLQDQQQQHLAAVQLSYLSNLAQHRMQQVQPLLTWSMPILRSRGSSIQPYLQTLRSGVAQHDGTSLSYSHLNRLWATQQLRQQHQQAQAVPPQQQQAQLQQHEQAAQPFPPQQQQCHQQQAELQQHEQLAQPCPPQQQQYQEQQQVDVGNSGTLLPYQLDALEAVDQQISTAQQRITVRLPPSASIQSILARLITQYLTTHSVLLLVSSSDRALALKSMLKPLLEPVGINPRVIPGELIRQQHPVVIVDLQQLQRVPSAMIHLQQQQQLVQQGLAIFEEGFMLQPEEAAGLGAHSSSSSSSNESCYLYDDSRRQLAEQVLRNLRYMKPDPNRTIVTLSSRGWHETLCQQQQQQQQLLRSGLIRPVETIRIPTGITIPVAAATPGSSDVSHLLSSNQRNNLIATSYNFIAGNAGKGLVIAAGSDHARGLAVALNLQGISSLVLHDQQSPEDQAAVLHEFKTGNDRVLVTGLAAKQSAEIKLSPVIDVAAVLMAAPMFQAQEYVARLAPVLLQPAAAAIRIADFVDHWVQEANGQAAAAAAVPSATARRRRSRPAAEAAALAGPPAAAAAGSCIRPLTCGDVLSGISQELPLATLPALLSLTTTSSSSSSRRRTGQSSATAADHLQTAASSKQQQQPRVHGDLIWVLLNDGSWAIPIKRGRGIKMAGMRILWLTKVRRGWVPQLEEGLGQMVLLPGTTGRPISLQKARTIAEAWMKSVCPAEAALKELGLEWRDRPITETQAMFCDQHNIPYDTSWTRGTINNMIDRYIVEMMHEPPTEKQVFLVKHFAPYAPSNMTYHNSNSVSCKTAADHLLQTLLSGNFGAGSGSSRIQSDQSQPGSAFTAAAAAAFGSSSEAVLPARQALLDDQNLIWAAGLRPKYTWMVVNKDNLLLDLMTGSFLWIQPAAAAAAAAAGVNSSSTAEVAAAAADSQVAQVVASKPSPPAAAAGATSSSTVEVAAAAAAAASTDLQEAQADANNPPSAAAAGALEPRETVTSSPITPATLNPAGLYHVKLQLPDGSFHPVTIPAAAAALITQYSSTHFTTAAAAQPAPLPLAAAVDRAEKVAQLLMSRQQAFLGREMMRIAGMVGGWKAPPKASETHMAMPASTRQLEALRAYGLPSNKRYTCLDVHRELARHMKSHGIPEPPATPTQLARMRELKLPLPDGFAERLTSAEAKAMLFRVHLAEEQASESKKKASESKQTGRGFRVRRASRRA